MDALLPEHHGTAAPTDRAARVAGVRAIAPLVAGLVPLAVTVGAAAARADLPALVGWASSATLYGASGQLTLVEMLGSGAPLALAVAATLIVNLQMLLYGTAMRAFWTAHPRRWRVGAAQLLVSPVFAVATSHHRTEPDPARQRDFYTGAAVTLWVAWLALTGAGYLLGGGLPTVSVLTLITPLVMSALALRAVTDGPTAVALAVAAGVAVAAMAVPYDLGFVVAGLTGMAGGVAAERAAARAAATPGEEDHR